jgi:hypothetical protein
MRFCSVAFFDKIVPETETVYPVLLSFIPVISVGYRPAPVKNPSF